MKIRWIAISLYGRLKHDTVVIAYDLKIVLSGYRNKDKALVGLSVVVLIEQWIAQLSHYLSLN